MMTTRNYPYLEVLIKGYNCEQIFQILLDPFYMHHNVCISFIVDLSKLKNPNDVHADDLGSWKCTGSRIPTFHVDIRDGTCRSVSNESASLTAQVLICVHVHACVCCANGNTYVIYVCACEGVCVYV